MFGSPVKSLVLWPCKTYGTSSDSSLNTSLIPSNNTSSLLYKLHSSHIKPELTIIIALKVGKYLRTKFFFFFKLNIFWCLSCRREDEGRQTEMTNTQ